MVNDLNIKYVYFNISNNKNRNTLSDKYFNLIGEGYENAIFLDSLLNILLDYKSYSKNIEISVFSDSISINCYYNKLYDKSGNYSKTINSYFKLMNQVEDAYDSYFNFIKDFC